MIVTAIDFSINSPAVVKVETDDNFNIIEYSYLGFSDKKYIVKDDPNILPLNKKMFDNDYERYMYVRDSIIDFLYSDNKHVDYCVIEGYVLGSTNGLVFNIAECTMLTKLAIYEKGTKIKSR